MDISQTIVGVDHLCNRSEGFDRIEQQDVDWLRCQLFECGSAVVASACHDDAVLLAQEARNDFAYEAVLRQKEEADGQFELGVEVHNAPIRDSSRKNPPLRRARRVVTGKLRAVTNEHNA